MNAAAQAVPRSGVVVADGYEMKLRVENSHLIVEDGIWPNRRERRFSRIAGLKRLVIAGVSGYVSVPALHFARQIGAEVIVLDDDGQAVFTSVPIRQADNPSLRRAQALAPYTGVGLDTTRMLIGRKLLGQAGVLRDHAWPEHMQPTAASAVAAIGATAEGLGRIARIETVRIAEARCAQLYFDRLQHVPLLWARQDRPRVRDHWRHLNSRHSPLTGSPRRAVGPGQAMLSYLYRLLEVECSLALHRGRLGYHA